MGLVALRRAVVYALFLAGCGRIGFPTGGDDITGDGGPTGDAASGDSGPLLDCTMTYPGARFCSTFEEPDMGGWDYTVLDEGTAALSTARAYRGAQSLEIRTTGADAYKSARWGKNYVFDEVAVGDIYIRGYYWIESSTVVTDQLSIMVTGNADPPYPSANVMLVPGGMHSNVDGENVSAAFEFPRDRWTCLLMHLVVGANGSLEVFVDATRVLSRTGFDTRVAGGYTNVDEGVHYATPAQAPAHFYVDEVVVDTSPVTCD